MESSAKSRAAGAAGWVGGRTTAPSAVGSRVRIPGHDALRDPWRLVRTTNRNETLRRTTNVVLALVGIVLAAPLMLLIALLVKLISKGPVFYTQERVGMDRRRLSPQKLWDPPTSTNGDDPGSIDGWGSGSRNGRPATSAHENIRSSTGGDGAVPTEEPLTIPRSGHASTNGIPAATNGAPTPAEIQDDRARDRGGRPFTIYKFRTMYADAGDEQVWARPDDDRVTPVGRVLRALHLDELPQLFNVLIGDMNVVGPRPEQPEIFERLARKIPGYRLRQKVRPGITGWAQVNHHYDRTLDDVRVKVQLDLEYLQRRSPAEDLKIVVKTVPAVLLGEDARGW